MADGAPAPGGQPGSQTIPASGRASEGSAPPPDGTRPSRRPELGRRSGGPALQGAPGGRGAESAGVPPGRIPTARLRPFQRCATASSGARRRRPGGPPEAQRRRAAARPRRTGRIGRGRPRSLARPARTRTLSRREPGTPAGARHARRVAGDGCCGCLASGRRRGRSARPRPGSPGALSCQPCLSRPPAIVAAARAPRPQQPMAPGGALPDVALEARASGPRRAQALAGLPLPAAAGRPTGPAVALPLPWRGARPGCGEAAGAKRGRAPTPRSRQAPGRRRNKR